MSYMQVTSRWYLLAVGSVDNLLQNGILISGLAQSTPSLYSWCWPDVLYSITLILNRVGTTNNNHKV